uniref:Uncharacterized protein n=1 Tax=Cacopsylla melanoneura TaxID=428564 RepID=A0A8D9B4Z1_9HEMI
MEPTKMSSGETNSTTVVSDLEETKVVKTEDLLNDIRMNAQKTMKPIKMELGSLGPKMGKADPDGKDRTVFISNITKFLPIVPQEINAWSPYEVGGIHNRPSLINDFVTRF